MRLLQRLLEWILFLLVFIMGVDYGLSDLGQLGPHPVLQWTGRAMPWLAFWDSPAQRRLFWLVLALMPLVYWAASFALWRRRPGAFRVQTGDGEVLLLEPGALIKFARLQVENHPAVVAHKVRVRQSGSRGLTVLVHVSVRPIQSLPSIRASLERSIRDGFEQVMGVRKIDEVRIVIGLDERSLSQRPGVAAEPEPKPEPPVRAPIDAPVPADASPLESEIAELAYRPAAWEGELSAPPAVQDLRDEPIVPEERKD